MRFRPLHDQKGTWRIPSHIYLLASVAGAGTPALCASCSPRAPVGCLREVITPNPRFRRAKPYPTWGAFCTQKHDTFAWVVSRMRAWRTFGIWGVLIKR